ncbi:ABC transporter permease [Streptomyces celluloflavus]|uniref:ABC transporter permease n=1 Tax=Streptomyces celluloflavus TaxID=58344 RepID=UPI0036B93B56
MLTIALQTLRTRFTLFIGTFIALSLGVALIAGTGQVLNATRQQSGAPAPGRYDAADVVVRAPQSYSVRFGSGDGAYEETRTGTRPHRLGDAEKIGAKVASVPGVAKAVVDRSVPARLLTGPDADAGAETVARGWTSASLAPFRLSGGHAPQRPGEAVLAFAPGAGPVARVGDRLTLLTAQGRHEVRVVGLAERAGATKAADGSAVSAVFLTDTEVRQLSPVPAEADAVAVVAGPGVDARSLAERIGSALPDSGLSAYTGGKKESGTAGASRAEALGQVATLLALMALIGCFVSVFVVSGTFAFSIAQRRRELALLRTVGATPSQVTRMVLAEAAVLGLVASVVGCVLGVQGSGAITAVLKHYGMAPADMTVPVSVPVLVISFVLGLVVALLGVFAASRRAAKVRPVETLRESDVETRVMTTGRWITGGLFLALSVFLLFQLPGAGDDGAVVISMVLTEILVVAMVAFAPLLVPPLVRVAAWPLAALTRFTGTLAADSARSAVRRTASCAAPILVTVAVAGSLVSMSNATSATSINDERAHLRAGVVVKAAGEVGVPADGVRALAGLHGVTGASPIELTSGSLVSFNALIPSTIGAVDADELAGSFRLTAAKGSLGALRGDTVAVSRTVADQAGWSVGEEVSLRLSDTTAMKLKVAAVLDTTAGLPGVLLPRDTLLRASPGLAPGRVYLALADGARPEEVARAAGEVARGYGAEALSHDEWLARSAASAQQEGRTLVLVLLGMALLYTGIAIANTLVMAAEQRAGGLLLLRRLGATGGQVVRSVLWETLTVVVVGGVLGIAAAGVTMLGMGRALSRSTGGTAAFPVPWAEMGMVLGGCLVVAVIASLIPTVLQLRSFRTPRRAASVPTAPGPGNGAAPQQVEPPVASRL